MPNQKPVPSPLPTQPRSKSSTILLFVITLILGGLGGYLIGSSKSDLALLMSQKGALNNPPASVSPSSPAPDETVALKTYTNETYDFSFKYPQNIIFTENTARYNQSVLELDWHQDNPYFEFTFQLTPMTPQKLINLTIGANGNNIEPITIDGVQGEKLTADGGIGGSVKQTVIYFVKGNLTYFFFTGGNPDLTNQILSTFKFTE